MLGVQPSRRIAGSLRGLTAAPQNGKIHLTSNSCSTSTGGVYLRCPELQTTIPGEIFTPDAHCRWGVYMSTARDSGKRYHRECTGDALETVRKHSERSEGEIQFFAACFCPFVQRVWIALEYLEIPYFVSAFLGSNAASQIHMHYVSRSVLYAYWRTINMLEYSISIYIGS